MTIIVRLNDADRLLVGEVAMRRNRDAFGRRRKAQHGASTDWTRALEINRVGAQGEYAAAIALRVDWQPITDHPDTEVGDVDGWQVRATTLGHGRLPLHRTDDPGHRFILVTGDHPWLKVRGWILGHEGQLDHFWETGIRSPCYMVPQRFLRSMIPK